jgi:tryptophanyl-tRNA synthetase
LANEAETKKKRVVSGMRPTGRLHIGHYFGALQNWVRLQDADLPDTAAGAEFGRSSATPQQSREYECFYFIADWHALTSDYADTSAVAQNTIEIVTDYLAAGLDPQKSVIFQQSLVPEHAELHLLLSMVTPLGWLERVPTYKEALENIRDKDLHNYGFLGYPVLQCADIVIYSEGATQLYVPTGEDQVSHVETSREIVRRTNFYFGFRIYPSLLDKGNEEWLGFVRAKLSLEPLDKRAGLRILIGELAMLEVIAKDHARRVGFDNFLKEMGPAARFFWCDSVLIEPESMVTQTPRVPGLDGRKMSKSYGNTIMLSESDADIRAKTKVMVTDPARKRRSDPGNPDVCPVYDWHKLFSSPETLRWAAEGCRTAGIGCIECKAKMADHLIEWITPVRERRIEYEKHPARVLEVIDEGSKRARRIAQQTMERVREAVFHWDQKRKEITGGSDAANA